MNTAPLQHASTAGSAALHHARGVATSPNSSDGALEHTLADGARKVSM
jgi:hypothetical protein